MKSVSPHLLYWYQMAQIFSSICENVNLLCIMPLKYLMGSCNLFVSFKTGP